MYQRITTPTVIKQGDQYTGLLLDVLAGLKLRCVDVRRDPADRENSRGVAFGVAAPTGSGRTACRLGRAHVMDQLRVFEWCSSSQKIRADQKHQGEAWFARTGF